jgi:hypothetical protein
MKIKLAVALLFLCSLTHCFAQDVLKSGGVALGVPTHGAYEFILWGGGPTGVNPCPMVQNGDCYLADGTFSLLSNGRSFAGKFNPKAVVVTRVDANCEQISFPVIGTLSIPPQLFDNVSALYTQTSCNLGGNNTSVFDAGGSLIVFLPGFVG